MRYALRLYLKRNDNPFMVFPFTTTEYRGHCQEANDTGTLDYFDIIDETNTVIKIGKISLNDVKGGMRFNTLSVVKGGPICLTYIKMDF